MIIQLIRSFICFLTISWGVSAFCCEVPDPERLGAFIETFKKIGTGQDVGSTMNSHAIDLYFRDKVRYRKAINELFLYAAHLGDKGAQYNRGRKLVEGDDIRKNKKIGRCWLEKAAAQNSLQALYYLGNLEVHKKSSENYIQANTYFKKAAELKYAPAFCSLGLSYLKGLGVKKDVDKAIGYFEDSVFAGSRKCATNLILLYTNGIELPVNYCLAKKWMQYPFVLAAIGEENMKRINNEGEGCPNTY